MTIRKDFKHLFDRDQHSSLLLTNNEERQKRRHERKVLTLAIIANVILWTVIFASALEEYVG